MTRTTVTRTRCAVLCAVVALVGATSVGAQAASTRAVVVRGSLHATMDAVTDLTLCQAQGGDHVPGPLDVSYSGTSVYTGTFQGTGRFCGRSLPTVNPDGSVPFVETDTFTGTVRGCGVGTVIYNVHGVINSGIDPMPLSLSAEEDWTLVARSGTSGLRGLSSGRGHDHAAIHPDTSIDADFNGKVSCVPSGSGPQRRTAVLRVSGASVAGPCLGLRAYDPLTGQFECDGFARIDGDWTGTGRFHAAGKIDPVSGDASGSVDQVLDITLADGRSGQVHLVGGLTVNGTTGAEVITGAFVGGTRAFAGARGRARFQGFAPVTGGPSSGTYTGLWQPG